MSEAVCRCGAGPHATSPDRCANGHALAGNEWRLQHGVRRFEDHGTVAPEVGLSVQEFAGQVVADRGGAEILTAVQRAYVKRLSELETVARLLASDLAQRGLFTPRGRVRSTFNRWLDTLSVWDRFAQRVGVDRAARPVPSLQEYLASRAEGQEAVHAANESGEPS